MRQEKLKKRMRICFISAGFIVLLSIPSALIFHLKTNNSPFAFGVTFFAVTFIETGLYFYVQILREQKSDRWYFIAFFMAIIAVAVIGGFSCMLYPC